MKSILLALLDDLKAAGKHATRTQIGEIFDSHFPQLVAASDSYADTLMSPAAKERGIASLLDATAAREDPVLAPVERDRRTVWALAAAAITLLAIISSVWFFRWGDEGDRIAIPSVPPRAATPDQPQLKGPDLERDDNPIVKDDDRRPPVVTPHIPQTKQRASEGDRMVAETQTVIGQLVSGSLRVYRNGSETAVALQPKENIYANSRIETGDGDKAEIKLDNGSILKLSFGTLVATSSNRQFELKTGAVFAEVTRMSEGPPFTITTAAASAGVMGTSFGITVEKLGNGQKRTVLQVWEGRVKFYNELDSVIVTDKKMSTAVLGSAPTEPVRINTLRIYGFSGTGQTLERRTFPLDEEGAASYYVYPLGTIGLMAGTVPNGELHVLTLEQDASARKAGLRVGDAILAIDGRRPTMDSLRRDLYFRAGERVVLRIKREGSEFDVNVPVAQERPMREVPTSIAAALIEATRPALEGNTDESLKRLQHLGQTTAHPAVFNNLGVVYERLDRMGPALRQYQRAVEMDGLTPLYRRAVARVLLNLGNFKRSIEELEHALLLDRSELETVLVLSDAYQVGGRMEDALKLMEESESAFAESPEFWIAKASVLMRADRLAAAIGAAREAIRIAPDNASAQFRLGLALTFSNEFEDAETAFARAIELDPCIATYYNSRAINLGNLGRHEEAEAEYRKALTLDPSFIPARLGLGGFLIGTGRNEEAVELLRKTVDLDPQNGSARYNLAIALNGLGRFVESEEVLRTMISRGFSHVDYHWLHAYVLGLLGKHEESVAAYERAAGLAPQIPGIRSALGWTLIEMHRWADAVISLRKAIELDPKGASGNRARMNLGFALIQLGNLEEAEIVLAEALKLAPDSEEARSRWALLLAHKGTNLDEALELAGKGPFPAGHGHLYYTIGYVHFRRAEYDLAENALTNAANDYGKVLLAADALVLLGQVREAKKDILGAIAAYKQALVIEPKNRTAADAIKRLG